ncbi:P-loop containing nucleoside triphosphate hydrolase protein [Rozella allomycis CSF55]|uniref:P-loop containing nucleoside triphosphate hydrolase protein n=1 Tax=Rozella allomycis (strain CSF55) TaxID=988480 RepID=A0A4V1IZJ8_ROZAC|nr:P-loop containing nucleoside triphosphate hydrolase protein [Rozella allomycis CSF55]
MGKKKSKRITCAQRYKIDRKIKEHHRKVRKEARKNPKPNALKKDPGIPNFLPFKDKVMEQVYAEQQQAEKQNELRRLAMMAMKKQEEFENQNEQETTHMEIIDTSKKAYYKEFKKVVEDADVILQVVDARDPLGCRTKSVEDYILQKNKKLVLILNKIDLVPRENVEAWLSYLRQELPTVAFKASTQSQRNHLGQAKSNSDVAHEDLLQKSECLGADSLIKILKNYCRNIDMKKTISVGIIGYPNVGKSSVINSLKRSRVCQVGSTPGVTKTSQEIHLDKNIKLLDCPGIVFSAGKRADKDLLLRNCIKVDDIEDPVPPVELILSRCSKQQWTTMYGIPEYRDVSEFLLLIAKKRGKLRKGGIADLDKAARSILHDWNSGRIPFFTIPPAKIQNENVILTSLSKEFDLNAISEEQNLLLSQVKDSSRFTSRFVKMAPDAFDDVDMEAQVEAMDQDDEEMMAVEVEEDQQSSLAINTLKMKRKKNEVVEKEEVMDDFEASINPQINKKIKRQLKKLKKKEQKMARDDLFDFSTDFVPSEIVAMDDNEFSDDQEEAIVGVSISSDEE